MRRVTHRELLVGNTAGVLVADCDGALVVHQTYEDHSPRFEGPRGVPLEVTIYRCTACECLISTDNWRGVRNSYAPPVCALAEAPVARGAPA